MSAVVDPVDPEQLDQFARTFRLFVAADCNRYTPLYARLGLAIAEDRELLALLAAGRPGQRHPPLLLAAVHRLVLDQPDAPLARFYPSVTGSAVPPGDPFPAFRELCSANHDALVALLRTRSTQTNEVNRSVAVRAALGAAVADLPTMPVALLDLGSSAGLNLAFDRYELPGWFGPPGSPVQLACEVLGAPPPFSVALPEVPWRRGLDRQPVSVFDDEDVRWLEACVWPEQLERVERFRAAVRLARLDPPTLVTGDVVDDLPRVAADAPDGTHLVVVHSWMLSYLERSRRQELVSVIGGLAEGRPVTWVSAEAPGVVPGLTPPPVPDDATEEQRFATVLGMQRFREGTASAAPAVVARCHPHLRWIEWVG